MNCMSQQVMTIVSLVTSVLTDSIIQIIRNDSPSSSPIDEIINMEGASRLIIVEELTGESSSILELGPQFDDGNATDKDLSTFATETIGAGSEIGVFDFQSNVERDLFIKADFVTGDGTFIIETSPDNISYTLRFTLNSLETVEDVVFSGVFRYARVTLNPTSQSGTHTGELFEVSGGIQSTLVLEVKNDANGSAFQTLESLPSFASAGDFQTVQRVTHIGPDIVEVGTANSTLVKRNIFLPNLTGQMKITDSSVVSRTHPITAIKIFTGA